MYYKVPSHKRSDLLGGASEGTFKETYSVCFAFFGKFSLQVEFHKTSHSLLVLQRATCFSVCFVASFGLVPAEQNTMVNANIEESGC